jgi:tryptophan synthase alpha chain
MINSNITLAFENCKLEKRPALLTYIVGGDPNKNTTLKILNSIASYVDVCEIGMPHNTSVADGKQIQNSSYRALKAHTKLYDVFEIVKKFKKTENTKPVILMGYFNQILQFGENKFLQTCKSIGVDGLIVVDLPFPENKMFADKCKKHSINFIQLLAPTTSNERMKQIIKNSHDMIYYISMLSTTGGKLKVSPKKILKNYFKIKRLAKNKNVVIGFGITEKTIKSLKAADGLVVGSQLCKAIGDSLKARKNPTTTLNKIVKSLRSKIQ